MTEWRISIKRNYKREQNGSAGVEKYNNQNEELTRRDSSADSRWQKKDMVNL